MKLRLYHIFILSCLLIQDLNGQFYGTARFDSVFTEYFRRNSGGWTAGDATISVPLTDKRVIWLFGDSYIVDVDTTNNTLPCLFQIRNCMMVQDSVDRNEFITYSDSTATGINRTFFKLPENPEFQLLWPNHGFEYNDTVFIFLEHDDNITWELLDIYVAKLLMPGLQQLELKKLPDMGDFNFGRCVLTDSVSGYRYIYGNKVNWIVQEPFIARCQLDGLFGPWEFWTGSEWSDNITWIKKISELPVSPSYSVIKYSGRYYLITQENGYLTCGLGREIYSYESDLPQGPFVNKTLLYTEESQFNGRYLLTYNAYSHPYFTENGELLISYNVNDWVDTLEPYICPSQCVNVWQDRMDADTYRPKFIRVPMSLITNDRELDRSSESTVLYPNPVKVKEKIRIRQVQEHGSVLIILNIKGQVIYKHDFCLHKPGEGIEFPAPGLAGFYLLKLIQPGREALFSKLIVVE